MDGEMLTRITKAILDTPNASDYERLVAINVVKAMREPTEKMQHIMQASLDCVPIYRCEQQSKQVWQNTLDSIIIND